MRHRSLSDEELNGIINLKRAGTSWVKIQAETGINRRTAKRAYEKWERSQSLRELRDARKEVSAAEFRHHIEDLKNLAMSLAINSSVPPSPADMTNTEQFFPGLFEQDLLQRFSYMGIETKQMSLLPGWNRYMDKQFSIRENELLFQSLQDHIRAEVGRWNALEQWKEARDNSAKVLDKLRKETRVVVNNFLKQERETNFLQRTIEASGERKPVEQVEQMAEAALNAIWRDIREGKLGQNLVEMVLGSGQSIVRVGDENFFIFNDTTRAQKVTHICNKVINNLEKGEKSDMVKSLQDEVRIMKKSSEELCEMLNPVKLTPVILRTRCDLCPA
ncbi:hypothetical protein ES703_58429 [subsurface metagenome]